MRRLVIENMRPSPFLVSPGSSQPSPFPFRGFSLAAAPRRASKAQEQRAKRNLLADLRALTPDLCHLITLSARASTFCGIVRPICFAVFRLMTSSNFVGCSTGRSAGLAPFIIFVHVGGDAPVAVRGVRTVGHQPASIYSFSVAVHQR
jgi:hypothetical protein